MVNVYCLFILLKRLRRTASLFHIFLFGVPPKPAYSAVLVWFDESILSEQHFAHFGMPAVYTFCI